MAAVTDKAAAQSPDIRGEVTFAGGGAIPKGQIEIYLDDPAIQDSARRGATEARFKSDGASRMLAFSLAQPESLPASPTRQIVALLEREDGWLLARGSAKFDAGSAVYITLNRAMY